MTVSFIKDGEWVKEQVNLKTDAEAIAYIKENVPPDGRFKIERG